MTTLTIIQIGDEEGIILPGHILEKLRVGEGSVLHFSEISDGFMIRTADAEFKREIEIAEKIMHENYDVLRRLADS